MSNMGASFPDMGLGNEAGCSHKLPSVGGKEQVHAVVLQFHLLVQVGVDLLTNSCGAVCSHGDNS